MPICNSYQDTNRSKADVTFIGEHPGDYSEQVVAGVGDVNGDGYEEIFIETLFNGNKRHPSVGKSYSIFGKATGYEK